MSIVGKLISTVATKSVVKTVGKVAVSTTAGICDEVEKRKKTTDKSLSSEKKELVSPPYINDYIGDHYLKVRAAFVAHGFTDISYIVKADLHNEWFTKDGEVEEITINGSNAVKKNSKFPPNAPVVIVYHTLKKCQNNNSVERQMNNNMYANNVHPVDRTVSNQPKINMANNYATPKRLSTQPNQVQSNLTPPIQIQNNSVQISTNAVVYCCYCGAKLDTSHNFCYKCGNKVYRQ